MSTAANRFSHLGLRPLGGDLPVTFLWLQQPHAG